MSRVVNVFAQKTPNPNAYKFPTSLPLVPEGCFEVRREDLPTGFGFLDEMFARWDICRVYLASNFVTVLKSDKADWLEISREIRDYLAAGLREGTFEPASIPSAYQVDASNNDPALNEWFMQRILPATEQDGGGIFLKEMANGEMKLMLAGACNSCPYAPQTIEKGIVEPLTQQLKGLKRVLVDDVTRLGAALKHPQD